MRPILLPLVTLLAHLPAQSLALLEGCTPQDLALRVVAESQPDGPGAVVVRHVEVLPIELSGRLDDQELRWDQSRRLVRHGLARIELPGGGRLLHYRRHGGDHFGYLWVPADGSARVALERPARSGHRTPFADRIGVAADGRYAVVPLHNGDVCVLRLDGGTFASTGTASRGVAVPHGIVPASVRVGRSMWFGVTCTGRLLRCPLADGGTPHDCTPANATPDPRLCLSGDGSCIAFVGGNGPPRSLFLLREDGPVAQLPPPPANYLASDHLPEGSGKANMLLNHDGSRLFYADALAPDHDECYLLDLDGILPAMHITDDAVFEPYIGVHIMPAFAADKLHIALGDPGRMDWFTIEMTATGGQSVNLTRTNPATQPFFPGTIDPLQVVVAGDQLLATERTATSLQALRRIDPANATTQLLATDLVAPVEAGCALSGPPDLLVRTQQGDRLFRGSQGTLLAAAPPGISLRSPSMGATFGTTWVELGGGVGLIVFYLPDGTVLACDIEQGVTQLAMTQGGGCFVNGPAPRYLAPGVFRPLDPPAGGLRLCISGAGG